MGTIYFFFDNVTYSQASLGSQSIISRGFARRQPWLGASRQNGTLALYNFWNTLVDSESLHLVCI